VALSDVPTALVIRCQAGEERAFDELFRMIHDDLFRWAFSLVRDEDDALEITQDCFIRVFRHLPKLEDPARFPQWVSRLLVNQTNTYRVKKNRSQTEEFLDQYDVEDASFPLQGKAGANPRHIAERKEILNRVNESIRELPPRQRQAVLLFDVQGKSIREIAETLGCSEGAVKFNIFQGRRKLRLLLEEYVDKDGNLSLTE
jgi:RNA polymerase sigma-70 factor (ECF subfamily)